MKNKNMIITALVIIIIAAAAFYGGVQYQKSQRTPLAGNGQFARFGQGGNGGGQRFGGRFGANGGGAVVGEIIAADDKSITVKLPDGSSKIVLVTSSSTINTAAKGSISDLKTGVRVAAFGMTNSDGSVTAQNIQINPMMRGVRATPAAK